MGASSGLILAFVVVVWAAYFVPLVLRRYDEASRNASVEHAGQRGRIIRPTSSAKVEAEVTDDVEKAETVAVGASPRPARNLDRPAARLAARRRRRTLLTLVALLVVTSGVAIAGVISKLAIVVPVVLIVAWLVACRIQVRRELGISRPRAAKEPAAEATSEPLKTEDEDTVVVSHQFEDVDPGRVHVMEHDTPLAEDALDDQIVIAVPSASTSGEALWDPLPITVPTYVTKPRAGRTVRTIDFAQPGTWTSGHIEGENTELPKRATEAEVAEEPRAVNG